MIFFMFALPLFIIQCVLWLCIRKRDSKYRWILLIIPALFFIILIPQRLFRTSPDVPAIENAKMNAADALINCLYVLLLLVPFAFTFIKKTGWRVLIMVVLMLNMPLTCTPFSGKSYWYGFPLYTVKFLYNDPILPYHDDPAKPYVRFQWNWILEFTQ